MSEYKLCPLRKGMEDGNPFFEDCQKNDCAWWISGTIFDKALTSGHCAIKLLALNSVKKNE